jgi:hypothetical protein
MSNMGLGEALKKMAIENVITGVGDRFVMEEMRKRGAVLGGEESGHTVFLEHQTTGDGMLTALKLLEIMAIENKSLSELKTVMTIFPQVLINVAGFVLRLAVGLITVDKTFFAVCYNSVRTINDTLLSIATQTPYNIST